MLLRLRPDAPPGPHTTPVASPPCDVHTKQALTWMTIEPHQPVAWIAIPFATWSGLDRTPRRRMSRRFHYSRANRRARTSAKLPILKHEGPSLPASNRL